MNKKIKVLNQNAIEVEGSNNILKCDVCDCDCECSGGDLGIPGCGGSDTYPCWSDGYVV